MGQTIRVETTDGPKMLDLESCSEMVLVFNGARHVVTQANIRPALMSYMQADVAYQQLQIGLQAARDFNQNSAAMDQEFRRNLLGR